MKEWPCDTQLKEGLHDLLSGRDGFLIIGYVSFDGKNANGGGVLCAGA